MHEETRVATKIVMAMPLDMLVHDEGRLHRLVETLDHMRTIDDVRPKDRRDLDTASALIRTLLDRDGREASPPPVPLR